MAQGDATLRDYFCYVMLDFVTVDRDLGDVALAAALVWSRRLNLKERFADLAQKELGAWQEGVRQDRQGSGNAPCQNGGGADHHDHVHRFSEPAPGNRRLHHRRCAGQLPAAGAPGRGGPSRGLVAPLQGVATPPCRERAGSGSRNRSAASPSCKRPQIEATRTAGRRAPSRSSGSTAWTWTSITAPITFVSLQIGRRGEPITQPVYLPGYVSWEHEIGHHDPLDRHLRSRPDPRQPDLRPRSATIPTT